VASLGDLLDVAFGFGLLGVGLVGLLAVLTAGLLAVLVGLLALGLLGARCASLIGTLSDLLVGQPIVDPVDGDAVQLGESLPRVGDQVQIGLERLGEQVPGLVLPAAGQGDLGLR